jgi:hypothetical protein
MASERIAPLFVPFCPRPNGPDARALESLGPLGRGLNGATVVMIAE